MAATLPNRKPQETILSTSILSTRRHLAWRAVRCLGTAALAAFAASTATAQDGYPNKPVQIVVPYAAGGSGDVVTRLVAQGMSARMKQQFIVVNKPGAGGANGASYVGRSAPDGYTLSFAAIGYNLIPAMHPELNVNPGKELAPIGLICTQPYVLVARADAPFKTVPELVAHAKAHPGEVRLAHAGVGTLIHLFGAWLAKDTGIKLNEIPYSGSAPALNSVLAGQTDIDFDPPSNSLPHLSGGKIRALATTGAQRMPVLKDVPTLKELGYGISGATWFGLMAPKDTPKPIIERLNKVLNAVLQEDEVKQRLEAMHYTIEPTTPEGFGKFFDEQTALWTKIIKDNKVKGQ
jgi:tripartite-type tricarboxylate transporter receptor subunit TctC